MTELDLTPVKGDSPSSPSPSSQDTDSGPVAVPGISALRRWLAILALALGGFGIGVTEFVTMGLLPDIARDLMPAEFTASAADATASTGLLVSAYALGVVIGAPTIAALAARWPRKRLLIALVTVFVIGNLATAILPSFGLVLLARFVSALPHGAYFGIASLVAASLMGPDKRARGVAFVLGGLTIANIVGVPFGTFLGQSFGWRSAYFLVAVIFVITLVAIVVTVPFQPGDPRATLKNELSAFTRLQVWMTLILGSIGFGGVFAVYTYVAPVVTDVTHLPASTVPFVLVVFGVGMTIGNFTAGWLADRSVKLTLLIGVIGISLAVLSFGLFAHVPAGLFVSILFVGLFAGTCGPAVQTRLMDVSHNAQSIAAALNHSALNLGNSLGAFLGGLAIAAGLGYISPAFVGVLLGLVGLVILLSSFAVDRHRARATRA